MDANFNPWKHFDNFDQQIFDDKTSTLPQWPIKLWQVPEVSPYFHYAHLLIAADCSAFACPSFHALAVLKEKSSMESPSKLGTVRTAIWIPA